MDRRTFSRSAVGVAGALALAGAGVPLRARAQANVPTEGRDFRILSRPVPVPADGRIEVTEFFWYACPHCFAFEPLLEAWMAKLPADIRFSRVPVGFDALKQTHQRIFYTWEALGLVEQMHMKTFERFHVQKKPIDGLEEMLVFARENHLDAAKVQSTWNSFSVQSKCTAARQLEDAYGIDHMPEMAIAGKFTATAQPESGPRSVLQTTDALIDLARRGH